MILEYTLASLVMLAITLFLNLRFNPHFRNQKVILIGLGIALFAQLIMDNLTAGMGFWTFNMGVTLGIRVPIIPLENLMFGASLFLFTIFCWESFQSKQFIVRRRSA